MSAARCNSSQMLYLAGSRIVDFEGPTAFTPSRHLIPPRYGNVQTMNLRACDIAPEPPRVFPEAPDLYREPLRETYMRLTPYTYPGHQMQPINTNLSQYLGIPSYHVHPRPHNP
jgi:hypothetical protein